MKGECFWDGRHPRRLLPMLFRAAANQHRLGDNVFVTVAALSIQTSGLSFKRLRLPAAVVRCNLGT